MNSVSPGFSPAPYTRRSTSDRCAALPRAPIHRLPMSPLTARFSVTHHDCV